METMTNRHESARFDFSGAVDRCPVCGGGRLGVEKSRAYHGAKFSWTRCADCRLFFQNPQLTSDSISNAYSATDYFGLGPSSSKSAYKNYLENDRLRIAHSAKRLRTITSKAGLAGGRLLDIGSASGFFGAAAVAQGFDVTCVEPSHEMASIGREHYHLEFYESTLEDLEIKQSHYDLITLWGTDSHFTNIMGSFKKIFSALKPGAFFAMNYQDYDHWIRFLFPDIKIGWNVMFNLTDRTIDRIMADCGAKIIYRGGEWQTVPVAHFLRLVRFQQPAWTERVVIPLPSISLRTIIAQKN